jgi:hypothetical protein
MIFGIAAGAAAVLRPVKKLCASEDVFRLHDLLQREQTVAA